MDQELPSQHLSKELISSGTCVRDRKIPEIVSWSGKMLILERLLPTLFEKGHKVLIFSQMTRMLDIIADWFEFIKGWQFCRIDGAVKIDDRRDQV